MSEISDKLYSYIYNPSSNNQLDLAEAYFLNNQYAAAFSFFLRTAETSFDKNLQYYCLIKCAFCFDIPGNRKHSVITLYKHAIHLLPDRPEAYFFLSKTYEQYQDWYDCYIFAHLGLEKVSTLDIYSKKLNYTGEQLLIFEKAISAWHVGKGQESRDLFQVLIHQYNDKIEEPYRSLIVRNACSLGTGTAENASVVYQKGNKLRFNFENFSKIERNYSQLLQDIFILSILNGKENGIYLEIGSGDPVHFNNTFLLETEFNWKGIGIEINSDLANKHDSRKNKVICEDARTIRYEEVLNTITDSYVIDYLQLDCEPSDVTYDIMTRIPFDKYKFAVITYEHDDYVDISRQYKNKSRKFLQNLGYLLVVNDVSVDGKSSTEDWWVYPDLISDEILKIMTSNDLTVVKNIKNYMYGQ